MRVKNQKGCKKKILILDSQLLLLIHSFFILALPMQDKVITVPFYRAHYIDNQKFVWGLMYKEVSPSYIIYSVITVFVLIIGLSIDLRGGLPLTTIVGICMLISIFRRFWEASVVKKKFFTDAEAMADKYESELGNPTYAFTDAGVTYTDNLGTTQQSWDTFDRFIPYQDILLLRTKESDKVSLVLSCYQLSDNDFIDIKRIFTEQLSAVQS
jgi:hypothetical protein